MTSGIQEARTEGGWAAVSPTTYSVLWSFLILQCLGLLSTLYLPEEGRGGSLGDMSVTCFDVTLLLDTVSLYQFPVLLNSYFMVFSHFSSRRRMIDSQIGALGLLVSGWGLLKSSLYIHFYVKYNHLAFAFRTRAIRILITDTIVENDLGISHCYRYIQRRWELDHKIYFPNFKKVLPVFLERACVTNRL